MKFDKIISRFLGRDNFDQELIAKKASEKPPMPEQEQVIDNGQKKDVIEMDKEEKKPKKGGGVNRTKDFNEKEGPITTF